MSKAWLSIGGGILSTALAIMIQKADHVHGIWYAWILEDPHVVPSLLTVAAVCFLVALGQWRPAGEFYWKVFSKAVPTPALTAQPNSTEYTLAHRGLQITNATWRCVDDRATFNEVTGVANSLVRDGKTLTVSPENRLLGDPCNKHKPYTGGHHKNLEISYVFRGSKLLSEYEKPHTLSVAETWVPGTTAPEDAHEGTKAALNAAQAQIEILTRRLAAESNMAIRSKEETEARTKELQSTKGELDGLRERITRPPEDTSGIADGIFQRIRNAYLGLNWQQRVALKWRFWT